MAGKYLLPSLLLGILLLFAQVGWAASNSLDGLLSEQNEFLPVEKAYKVNVGLSQSAMELDWIIEPGYYLYKDKFKLEAVTSDGSRTLDTKLGQGVRKFDEYFQEELELFYNNTQITAPIADLPNEFVLKVRSQGCADAGLCYAPRTQYFEINRKFQTAVETDSPASATGGGGTGPGTTTGAGNPGANADSGGLTLLVSLLLAAGGGFLLNLMPCVFPVLSLKALSFASNNSSPHRHHLHGWAYTLGVVGSFLVVALLILVARAAGQTAGWGFQLQSPVFVGILAYLFFVMGLSLSGMVTFGTSLMGIGHGLTTNSGLRGSFFTGVLAAVVASPCTGPMMAPALGYALTQPASSAILVFTALGFGMALPFLLLSYSPGFARMLPRPGAWMEKLKQFLAFPMYLTAVWLVYVFGRQVGLVGLFFLCSGAVGIALAIWLFNNLPMNNLGRRLVQATAVATLLLATSIVMTSERFRSNNSDWQPFSETLVQDLRAQGRPVFVDFTADWCITCKANKALALSRGDFKAAVAKHNVALVQADWTNEDPAITKVLNDFQRSGVPLYVVYPANPSAQPEILPQLLTEDMVIRALERAAGGLPTVARD